MTLQVIMKIARTVIIHSIMVSEHSAPLVVGRYALAPSDPRPYVVLARKTL